MASIATTTKSVTYLKGTKTVSTIDITSASYVVVDAAFSFASVPALSKIYYHFNLDKQSAGTLDIRIRDTTNGVTLWEQTGITTSGSAESDITGTLLSHTLVGTVEVQMLSSDGNNAQLLWNTIGVSWICITDADDPIVLQGGPTSHIFSGKRSIGTIRGFVAPEDVTAPEIFNTIVSGLYLQAEAHSVITQESNSLGIDAMTDEIVVTIQGPTLTWTDTNGQAVVIIAWDGVHVEVTA